MCDIDLVSDKYLAALHQNNAPDANCRLQNQKSGNRWTGSTRKYTNCCASVQISALKKDNVLTTYDILRVVPFHG